MKITKVGIDLAKDVFQIHGVDAQGHVVLKKQLRRVQMASFFVNLPQCLIGMEVDTFRERPCRGDYTSNNPFFNQVMARKLLGRV